MDPVFASVDQFVRRRKELANGDTDPLLIVIRGDRLTALVESTDVSGLLAQSELAARGYDADFLALTFEGVVPVADVNPLTGQPWERGEADAVRLQHDGISRGWVEEIVVVAIVGRAGESCTTTYSITAVEDGLSWDSERFGSRPVGVESYLQQALAAPPLDSAEVRDPGADFVASDDAPFLTPEAGRLSLDIGCTRIIDRRLEYGVAALIAHDDREAATFASEGLMDWQVLRYR
ncbi:hypothetical protein [Mycobacterium sp. M26]|uniref:hypothetical protein n=1 Tax=Mycobacterium sp. M26 TaxID=1762962 RepID=UPI000AF0B5B8|nr:hypothetical protein [Mycobacterium sp. M26]